VEQWQVCGQGIADGFNGKISGVTDYAGSAIGGACSGVVLMTGSPVQSGLAGGYMTNVSKQALKNATGEQDGYNYTSVAVDSTVGAALGTLPPMVSIDGVNTGRNSMNAVYNQMMTKYNNGQIQNVTMQTAGKMFTGRATEQALVPGTIAGAAVGTYGSSNIPGYSDTPTSTDVAFNLGSEENNVLEPITVTENDVED